MPVTYIPQHELDEARRQAEKWAASAPPKTEMRGGDGVVTMRIPQKLYLNATVIKGHPLSDNEYWADMRRRHPEIVVKYNSRKTNFQVEQNDNCISRQGKLTRFGRVTFSKHYA